MRSVSCGVVALLLALTACAPASQSGAPAAAPKPASAPSAAPPAAAKPEWQVEWERVLAAAKGEGRVTVSGPPGDLIRRSITDAWRQAYPDIALDWQGGRTAESAAKLEAERRAGVYALDVFVGGTTTAATQVKPIGAMVPLKPALILPEVTDPRHWFGNKLEFADADEWNLVFTTVPKAVLAFTPGQVRYEDVDEVQELLDPRWKGKIVINDPIPTGGGNSLFRWLWHVLGPEKGAEYFRALREQAAVADRDQRRQVEWIARGRYPILLGPSDTLAQQLGEQGMEVELVTDFKGYGTTTSASYGSIMMIDRPPHPNAAKVFVNWLLSQDGQTAYSRGTQQPVLRLDVPTDHLAADTRLKPDVAYWPSYTEENLHAPPGFNETLREVFGR
jgi:iron(III) transport system substrate-binding protein